MRLQLRFCHMICSILLAAVALTIPALAQQASNKSTGQPPLIDRELSSHSSNPTKTRATSGSNAWKSLSARPG